MWSGPRNISTAMMRSFGARDDCVVVDEPLYAHYLVSTGLDHPARYEVIASQPQRWEAVAEALTGPVDGEVFYQKQMAHHMLPRIGRQWLAKVENAFLIRAPAQVVASYAKVRGEPTLDDLGYPQQLEIFRTYGGPVVDAGAVLRDPEGMLRRLCVALSIGFQERMLHWPPTRRDTDGVFAQHWYGAVERSAGFAPYDPTPVEVPQPLRHLVDQAQPYYDDLAAHAL